MKQRARIFDPSASGSDPMAWYTPAANIELSETPALPLHDDCHDVLQEGAKADPFDRGQAKMPSANPVSRACDPHGMQCERRCQCVLSMQMLHSNGSTLRGVIRICISIHGEPAQQNMLANTVCQAWHLMTCHDNLLIMCIDDKQIFAGRQRHERGCRRLTWLTLT
jgi:hypothetical protein